MTVPAGMTRRRFLGTVAQAASAVVAPSGMFASVASERKLRLAVVSDVHIGGHGGGELEKWKRTLARVNAACADAVVVAGDIANYGRVSEMEAFASAWFAEFPSDRRRDGAKIGRVFTLGNHDVEIYDRVRAECGSEAAVKKACVFHNRGKLWRELFGEEYSHFFTKEINGYTFIGSHWRVSGKDRHRFEAVELPDYLRRNAAALGKEKPFFFVQHLHPFGTCHGEDAWWPDSGKNTSAVLKDFPNAVAFSGHSHKPLTDERALWQGGFTSFGTSSLSYVSSLKSLYRVKGRSAGPWERPLGSGATAPGYLIDVHAGFLLVKRLDFLTMLPLGDDWIVPVPVDPGKVLSFASRAAAKRPPACAAPTAVKVSKTAGDGKGMTLVFPSSPRASDGRSRVYSYRISGRNAKGKEIAALTVRSPAADLPVDFEPPTVACDIPATSPLAKADSFEVKTVDCFGVCCDGGALLGKTETKG